VIEAEAALELGDATGAAAAVKRAPKMRSSPANDALVVVEQQAVALSARGKPKELAAELAKLEALSGAGKTQRGRHAYGATLFALGELAGAKRELRRATLETTPASPNPHGYRTRTLLAEIAIAEGDLALATQEIERALAIHEGNRHTRSVQAQIALRGGDPEKALTLLALLRKSGDLPALAQLVVAEALVIRKEVTADERAQARLLVTGLVGHPAVGKAELGRVAALVDPKLPGQLKLPVGAPLPAGA
jgi:tetratricopeptide (TPR) repeat protein